MACSCGGGQQGEQWQVVYADGQVGSATSKPLATAESSRNPGSYIRPAQTVSAR